MTESPPGWADSTTGPRTARFHALRLAGGLAWVTGCLAGAAAASDDPRWWMPLVIGAWPALLAAPAILLSVEGLHRG